MESIKGLLIAVGIFALSVNGNEDYYIPDYVTLCPEDSPDISECWKDSFNNLVPHLADDVPEMKLRKIEPLDIENVDMALDYNILKLGAQVSNVKLYGLSGMHSTFVDLDTDEVTIKIDGMIPHVDIEGDYVAYGSLFEQKIERNGTFIGNCTKIIGETYWTGRKILKDGVTYLSWETSEMDFEIMDVKMRFNDLVPTKSLNDLTNFIINANIQLFIPMFKPYIIKEAKSIFLEATNNVTLTFPFNKLYPD